MRPTDAEIIEKIQRKVGAVLPDRELVYSVYGVGDKYDW